MPDTRLISIESQPKKVIVVFVIVVVFVVSVVVFVYFVLVLVVSVEIAFSVAVVNIVHPRNLTLKSSQNQVSNS